MNMAVLNTYRIQRRSLLAYIRLYRALGLIEEVTMYRDELACLYINMKGIKQ